MISRAKRIRKNQVSVLDIETAKNGDLLAMSLYDGKKIFDFYSWGECLQFLEDNNNKPRFRNIVAHNGGGFDWISLVEAEINTIGDMRIITSGSGIIFIQMNGFKRPVMLMDSILVLHKGLNALCDTFDTKTKKLKDFDIDRIEEIFTYDKEMFFKYLHNDVISLYEVIEQFKKLLDIEFWPVTAASLAMYIFRERYLPEGVNLFQPDFKPGSELDLFITQSYAGGRVECFRPGIYAHVNVYDINSLYPYCMTKAQIPDCLPVQSNKHTKGEIGFYKIKFNQTNRNLPPVLWHKTKMRGLEFIYEGEGTFCTIEIDKAIEVGTEIEIIEGYYYPRTKPIFKDYVTSLYDLRLQNKGTPLDYICKILLNSLYGKFAQKEESTHLEIIRSGKELMERLENGEKIIPYDEERCLFSVGEEREIAHRLIHVASIITSMARCELYSYLQQHKDDIIYCDTDSIHITGELDNDFIGNKLGQMKLEETGPGVYLGRKQYGISKKIKFKGVTVKDKLSSEDFVNILTMEHLKKIYRGEEMEFSFHTFPKLKSVLRGKKACKKLKITKKLKKPDYTSNFIGKKDE